MKKIGITLVLFFYFISGVVEAQESNQLDSLKNFLATANQKDSCYLLIDIGEIYFAEEDYSTSLDYFFSALKLSEGIHYTKASADAANSIGRVYYNLENFTDGLEYFKKAHDYFRENEDEQKRGGVLNNIALIYYEIDSTEKSIEYYNKALTIKKEFKDTLNIGAIHHNLGLVYMNQNRYEEAVENLLASRQVFVELGKDKFAANTTNNIGRAYYKGGKYEEALSYFNQGLAEAKAINSAFLIMDNYKYQADCYAKMDIYNEAYRFSNEHYKFKDSLLNIDKKKEIAEIQARYENEMLRKENETNTTIIKMQYFGVVGVGIITILLAFLTYTLQKGNQQKKKANDLLRNQKVEIQEKNDVLSKLNEEIIKQNEAIKVQKTELEELNGIKDKLFSIISHEFRSPLNSLKGTLTLLKVGALTQEELNLISKELTDKINNTSIFLDNLLNWAKSQMQGIKAKPSNIDIKELADDNIILLQSLADKKKIRLKNNIDESISSYVDPNMMNLVLRNLISNAIKFSLKGGVIEVDIEPNSHLNTISVSDNGIGMSKENVKMLFKVQSFTTRGTANERGTGLGLYISKNFIKANGGDIWVESEEGKGSTFKFTVPSGN